MRQILFLEPVFKEMIWGGSRLASDFGYEIPGEHTGECWAVSAHANGDCTVHTQNASSEFHGKKLSSLWKTNRELFGNVVGDVFPLLTKIIDAKADLSIQVHPDDSYAALHENGALGKTECWYILDCEPGAKIIVGHHAQSKEELREMIAQNRWSELIHIRDIHPGDFFQIEPGTVHAIKEGTLLLETQQSSDITYRLYDYDRLQNGSPRELHIEKSIDVIRCPAPEQGSAQERKREEWEDGSWSEELIACSYYKVSHICVRKELVLKQTEPFTVLSVIDGAGHIDGIPIQKGSHFILPAGYGEYRLCGSMELIRASI